MPPSTEVVSGTKVQIYRNHQDLTLFIKIQEIHLILRKDLLAKNKPRRARCHLAQRLDPPGLPNHEN